MRRVVVLAWLFCGLLAACAPTALADAPSGAIVAIGFDPFSHDDWNDGVFVVDADGSGFRQLTHDVTDEHPSWSPDGSLIVFGEGSATKQPGKEGIVLIAPDGTGRRVVGVGDGGALGDSVPWSPDGSRLAWPGCGGLCVFDLPTARTIGLRLGTVDGFAWSPDGTEVAAATSNDRIVVVRADGLGARVIATDAYTPVWSPDGSQIAFVSLPDHRLETVPAGGGRVTVLAAAVAGTPHWAPDGRSILADRAGGAMTVDVADGRVTPLRLAHTSNPQWSPDGTAVVTEYGGDLWIVPLEDGAARRVTSAFPTGDSFHDPEWTARPVAADTATRAMLAAPPVARLSLDHVDELAPFGTDGDVAVGAGAVCSYDAETEAALIRVWTPGGSRSPIARGPCGNYGGLGSDWTFAGGRTLVGWETSVVVSVQQSDRDVVGVAKPGDVRGTVRASWQSIRYNAGLGRVDSFPVVLGDGTAIDVEGTWGRSGRALWRIDERRPSRPVRIPLPRDATIALAADAGRVVLATSGHGLVVVDGSGHVRWRIPRAAADEAALGGGVLAARSGTALTVYGQGRPRSRLMLAGDSGTPRLLAVRRGVCVYASGIAIHVLRLRDGSDRVLSLPDEDGPVDAVMTRRGLYVSYDRRYARPAGQVVLYPWTSLG